MAIVFTAPLEALLDQAWKNDDRAAIGVILDAELEAILANSPLEPSVSSLTTPGIGTALQLGVNRDFFRGRDIVPQSEEGRPPEQQYDETSSSVAVFWGTFFKASPRKFDFA